MNDPREASPPILVYGTGSADDDALNAAIVSAWREALDDERARAEIAKSLNVAPEELDPGKPPFAAKIKGAGTFGGEVLILLVAPFFVGVAKELSEEAGRAVTKLTIDKCKFLWGQYFARKVCPPGSGRLGEDKRDDEG